MEGKQRRTMGGKSTKEQVQQVVSETVTKVVNDTFVDMKNTTNQSARQSNVVEDIDWQIPPLGYCPDNSKIKFELNQRNELNMGITKSLDTANASNIAASVRKELESKMKTDVSREKTGLTWSDEIDGKQTSQIMDRVQTDVQNKVQVLIDNYTGQTADQENRFGGGRYGPRKFIIPCDGATINQSNIASMVITDFVRQITDTVMSSDVVSKLTTDQTNTEKQKSKDFIAGALDGIGGIVGKLGSGLILGILGPILLIVIIIIVVKLAGRGGGGGGRGQYQGGGGDYGPPPYDG